MTVSGTAAAIRRTIPASLDRGAIIILGGVIEMIYGVNAEGKSLETVTKPLTSVEA